MQHVNQLQGSKRTAAVGGGPSAGIDVEAIGKSTVAPWD